MNFNDGLSVFTVTIVAAANEKVYKTGGSIIVTGKPWKQNAFLGCKNIATSCFATRDLLSIQAWSSFV